MVEEKCPGCKRVLKWDNDMGWYCVEGEPSNVVQTNVTSVKGVDHKEIDLHFCPYCERLLVIQVLTTYGGEVFVNCESVVGLE